MSGDYFATPSRLTASSNFSLGQPCGNSGQRYRKPKQASRPSRASGPTNQGFVEQAGGAVPLMAIASDLRSLLA